MMLAAAMRALNTFSITAGDNGTADPTINAAELQAPGTVNNGVRALMARLAALWRGVSGAITLGGTASAMTFTSPSGHALTSIAAPLVIWAKAAANNTGALTLNPDGLGATAVKRQDGSALEADDIVAGGVYGFAFDGTNFKLLNPEQAGEMADHIAAADPHTQYVLSSEIGSAVQAYHVNLAQLAGLSLVADRLPYANGTNTLALATLTSFGRSLIDDADAAAGRTTLGVVIGTNVQAYHVNLAQLAGLSLIADRLPYADGTNTLALTTLTSFGRSLIDDANAAAGRTTLGVVIGTDVQAYSAKLAAFAASSVITGTITVSTSAPSGGSDGDIWLERAA